MQRIFYIAAIRLPTEKAHGLQIMKMCEALASAGAQVELVVPGRKTHISDDAFAYYKVEKNFSITTCKSPDLVRFWRVGFLLTTFLFGLRVAWRVKREQPDVLYTRDRLLALVLGLLVPTVSLVFEVHGREPRLLVWLLARHVQFVAITQGVADMLVAAGAAPEQIEVAHDAVDLADFVNPESKEEARARLGIPLEAKVVMYIGRLDGWKGVGTLLEASKLLPNVQVVVIGGEPQQVQMLQAQYPQVHLLGYRPYSELADNQAAADVLVLPNTAKDETSARFTSPLKLFTYMTSGRPIVASDLPSLREVINDASAYFVAPDDAPVLAAGIEKALTDAQVPERAARARALVERYTWDARAERVLEFVARAEGARGIIGTEHRQMIKFLISGGLSALSNFFVLYVLTEFLHIYYLASAAVAFMAAFAVSFLLQKYWTFEHNSGQTHKQLMLYFAAAMINLVATVVLIYILTDICHLWYMFSAFVTALLVAIGSFFLYRSVIFV